MPELTKEQLYMVLGIILIVLIGCVYGIYSKNTIVTRSSPSFALRATEGTPDIINAGIKPKTEDFIYIHILGAVKMPGVYKLSKGDRLIDLLKLAKATQSADIDSINLAEILSDGQKIVIQSRTNAIYPQNIGNKNQEKAKQTVNINTADEKMLDSLPGIGPAMAKKIIETRNEKRKFVNIEELKEVPGISEKKYEKIRKFVTTH